MNYLNYFFPQNNVLSHNIISHNIFNLYKNYGYTLF